jgi:replicative DNA helicase
MLEVARDDRQQDFRSIEDVLHEEVDKLHRLSIEGTSLTGTPSGFKDLDEITGGFQPGNLIIIAARPAMGKSALVCNIAENAAVEHGKPVALFSLEMAEAELAQRFVASQARIKGEELRKGRVSEQRWPKILSAWPPRRCGWTTRATSGCSRYEPRPAACTASATAAWG